MLNRDCSKFNTPLKKAQRDVKSWEGEVDILKRANQLYRDEHNNVPFANDLAWSVLLKHKKWNAPEAVDLTGDVPSQTNDALFGHDEEPRPIGKKRAFKKQKFNTTTSTGGTASTGGSFYSFTFGEIMREKYRAKREDAARAYQVTAKNQATQQRLRELEILMFDTTGRDPTYVALVNMKKDRINKKLGLPPHGE